MSSRIWSLHNNDLECIIVHLATYGYFKINNQMQSHLLDAMMFKQSTVKSIKQTSNKKVKQLQFQVANVKVLDCTNTIIKYKLFFSPEVY